MTCSPARLAANRANAARSTGPKTAEGKERSRANAFKHGMTGEGVVQSAEDAGEVAARAEQLEREMRPSGLLGRILVRRVAALSVRLDRCVRHEEAMVARRRRDAGRAFEDGRMASVEAMGDGLADQPSAMVRGLRGTPEGIAWLIGAWLAVKADLDRPDQVVWQEALLRRVAQLMGQTAERFAWSPMAALCRATWGEFSGLSPDQGAGLDVPGRKAWAREQLVGMIEAEVEAPRALRRERDNEADALDRSEAADRALFDPSKEAALARKYEAAAERGLFRALGEFRRVEAEARGEVEPAGEVAEAEAEPGPAEASEPEPERQGSGRPLGRLGSFYPESSPGASPTADRPEAAGGSGWGAGGGRVG